MSHHAVRTTIAEFGRRHPLVHFLSSRSIAGIITLFAVSIVVFASTQLLPGNAAFAILGHTASPSRIHQLENQLHLNQSAFHQYRSWLTGILSGHPGTSLANGESVWLFVYPRLINSAVLVVLSGAIGTIIGVGLGALAALRRDRLFDNGLSIALLGVSALPEFVVAIMLIMLFSTVVFHVLPGVSIIPNGTYAWSTPKALILPVATLVVVIVPYIFRMMRAAMIEALDSDYVEMARLKGLSPRRVLLFHAIPNAIPPTVQVVGLSFLYLAGGIVVVEYAFDFPGIGQGLVNAVAARDVPVIQFMVIVLAAFYVLVNVLSDLVALLATPKRWAGR